MNAIGLVLGKREAEKKDIKPPDSTRIGVLSSLMPNPVMSLVIGRTLAEKEAPPPAPAEQQSEDGGGGGEPTSPPLTLADFQAALQPLVTRLTALEIAVMKNCPPPPSSPSPPKEPQQDVILQATKTKGGPAKGGGSD